jgi:uncharacterized protein YjbI with pentapeptide repeats
VSALVFFVVLGAAVLGRAPDAAAARRKGKGKGKNKSARPCYPGRGCIPGSGRDNAGCDFSGSAAFRELNAQGAHLAGTNFAGADLRGANLSGANLGKACLVGADLTGADLDGAKLKGAILCGTTLPDGSIDDSGCDQGTACCPTSPENSGGEEPVDEQCEICPQRYCCACEGGPESGTCRLFDYDPNAPLNIGIFCAQLCTTGTARFLFVEDENANFCDTSNHCVQLECPVT